jgi:hypothetical protein
MKLKNILYITLTFSLLLIASCGGSDSGGGGGSDDDNPMSGNDDPDPIPEPSSATLIFPENNTECNTGILDPNDETVSTVTFEWNASENTDRYTVNITNLNTGTTGFSNTNTNSVDITILRGVPYEWWVTSRANGNTVSADSERFRFYNEGPGVENYAPFPAVAVRPQRGINLDASTTSVILEWSGSDVDNDITGYEVFFGTDSNPTTSIGTSTENTLADVAIASGNTYYWRVVTSDSQNNTSTSEIFEFRVN